VWAKNLLIETGKVLLDREMDHPIVDEIREVIETKDDPDETRIADLHVWRVGKEAYACAVSIITHSEMLTPEQVRSAYPSMKKLFIQRLKFIGAD